MRRFYPETLGLFFGGRIWMIDVVVQPARSPSSRLPFDGLPFDKLRINRTGRTGIALW